MVDNLVEECNETIDEEVKPDIITPIENSYMHNSCTAYIVLFSIFHTIIVIGAYFAYYKYRNHNKKMFLDMIIFIKQQFTKHINGKN